MGLVEAVKAEAVLDSPNKDGETLRKRLRKFKELGDDAAALLEEFAEKGINLEAEAPPGGEALYRIFTRLRLVQGADFAGPRRISYGEVEAYCRLQGLALDPWEVDALMAMDAGFMAGLAEADKRK
jgi:hypothetical protein